MVRSKDSGRHKVNSTRSTTSAGSNTEGTDLNNNKRRRVSTSAQQATDIGDDSEMTGRGLTSGVDNTATKSATSGSTSVDEASTSNVCGVAERVVHNTAYCSLAPPEYICSWCNARMWFEERVVQTSTRRRTNFNMCCRQGRIRLPDLQDPPDFLKKLLDSRQGPESRHFKENIRIYNSCYAFTSMGAKIDNNINTTPGPYTFRISGQNSHYIGSLLPVEGQEPSFIQLYIYDTSDELHLREKTIGRREGSKKLKRGILSGLKQMLDDVNPLVYTFRAAQERIREDENTNLSIRLFANRERTHDRPTAPEIAGLIIGDFDKENAGRDIIIQYKDGRLQRIKELHPSYMALQYPILFPYGEDSYYLGILYYVDETQPKTKGIKRQHVTMREYYAYRLQQRESNGYSLLHGGKLLHQYMVDCCCAIESERLNFIRHSQPKIRCELLNNLCDAVDKGDHFGVEVGKRIILPASFTGGPRYMQQNYQDAMAICRWFGNPHLFITFTANPKWPEVTAMLTHLDDQRVEDRPDIIARVFKLKLRQLMDCLKKDHYFGTHVADVYTIEFQKRGLPHAHILLWLKGDEVNLSPEYINSIIHAEIPDKDTEPALYELVSRSMVHGPCGNANPRCSCMKNRTCSKKFPKDFNNETMIDRNGYPVYMRRDNGRYVQKGIHKLDNRHIVPYNPGLLLMFDAHINVEWCNTARAIKYLFKYILKGPDKATMVIKEDKTDEIRAYLDCRYLSACEAAWRIFEFDIQERTPSVVRLPVHLEGEQAVVLRDEESIESVIYRASASLTMLTGWMAINTQFPEACGLTYAQIPTKFVWDKAWHRRKKGMSIGRMAFVHPTAGERYYLRMLLNLVKGAKSFADIRTVHGHTYDSYKEACFALGLLNEDKEWHSAMMDANRWAMPSQLRELFVTILLFCEVTDVQTLWTQCYEMLSEDIEHKKRREFEHPGYELSAEAKLAFTLIEIDKILLRYGKTLKDIKGMPTPMFDGIKGMDNRLIRDERMYDTRELAGESAVRQLQLNEQQLLVYNRVLTAVKDSTPAILFLYGHGGTGKTFLYKAITAKLRSESKIVLNVASSGIAALLLPGGRTAHSRFEIPIDLDDNSTCNIGQQTQLAELIRQTSLIIWDEAPMDHKFAFEALDRTMRDIMGLNNPPAREQMFGGKVVLLGGDFRQVLPIIAKGTRQDIVQASLNRSYIWKECALFTLTRSMRVTEDHHIEEKRQRNKSFNDWLLAMGDGRLDAKAEDYEQEETWIPIPEDLLGSTGELQLKTVVDQIYPEFTANCYNEDYLTERAILTPLNETADVINSHMSSLILSEERIYRSCDEICTTSTECTDQFSLYPTEYLNSLTLQGLPHHELKLKVGMPVMLLRNLSPSQGLCNGTRLIVTRLADFIVEANILTGSAAGNIVLIPRIVMTTSDIKIPFVLKRRQYPLKPCYAMTINKSQGQTLTHVGVYLPKPVFSHGQLYVAASRTTSPEGLRFYIDDTNQTYKGHTKNIVYKEVFSNLM